MLNTMEKVKVQYEPRILALLSRWRQACLDRTWPTTEISPFFEKLPTGHPVHSWSFKTEVTPKRTASVTIMLETETDVTGEPDATADIEFVTVLHCFSSITFGMMGSDYVKWDVPKLSELLGDDEAIERNFQSLEQVEGSHLADAINHRSVN